MKVQFTFDPDEEAFALFCATNATALALAVYEVDKVYRGWLKHGHTFKTADEALEAARAALREEVIGNHLGRVFDGC